MSVRNFIRVLKRDVFKIDVTKPTPAPVAEQSRYRPGILVPSTSPFRYHAKYLPLMESTLEEHFQQMNVRCTVTRDPSDFRQLFHITNNGDKLLLIEYDREKHYLEPKQSTTFKVSQFLSGKPNIPHITALNNGV